MEGRFSNSFSCDIQGGNNSVQLEYSQMQLAEIF